MEGSLVDSVAERALVQWEDVHGQQRTLGSLTHANKHDSQCMLRVLLSESHFLCRLSLHVSFKSSGHKIAKQLLFMLPLDCFSDSDAFAVDEPRITEIGSAAASAHEAGLSESGRIIRVRFRLARTGYVLHPASKTPLRPATQTSCLILALLRSLSETRRFSLFIRPSGYARHGLRTAVARLQARSSLQQFPCVLADMYGGQGAAYVKWETYTLPELPTNTQRPPSYDEATMPVSGSSAAPQAAPDKASVTSEIQALAEEIADIKRRLPPSAEALSARVDELSRRLDGLESSIRRECRALVQKSADVVEGVCREEMNTMHQDILDAMDVKIDDWRLEIRSDVATALREEVGLQLREARRTLRAQIREALWDIRLDDTDSDVL
ncbi:hypothetical protein MPH_13420 [Macrophomina phaseolina MS6]|uniref:Uncharacterized protein n=1 Tax=Macrophomina phaseolina (strain MS6) TaxID=1126212 RepID=K2RYN2_MACPH|nr:hypothetical protein MPH_13420 [Macrophomina phaseolina MS6]